jgi:hypothetical protein
MLSMIDWVLPGIATIIAVSVILSSSYVVKQWEKTAVIR